MTSDSIFGRKQR